MSIMLKYGVKMWLCLVVYFLAISEQCLGAENVDKVLIKVGSFIKTDAAEFNVDMADLYHGYIEYVKLPESERKRLAANPVNKLVIDFCLKPMELAQSQIGTSKKAQADYLLRMQKILKVFWPAYKGIPYAKVPSVRRVPKMTKLLSILRNQDSEELTMRHFVEAKREAAAYRRHLNTIVDHEDIYANLNEMVKIMQYFNRDDFKLIHKFILPQVNEESSSNVEDLRRIFSETPEIRSKKATFDLF